ncbi:hypothetical protein JIQ42_06892 [Leishmania sp. Namibia]|uniref:hypothetical protein n=1 Tax=Leishmania sp. Namibia TaxID=2802991 RepID=UPI001B4535FE|nr:hypothetical protein JIQ42_06892 [Leishmania sp. Namibia]
MGDADGTCRWWSYAIGKVVMYQKAKRDRRRFDWVAYQRQKHFFASFFTFCLRLLQAPWIPDGEGQSVSEDQLARTSAQDVMACWNAARECLSDFKQTKRPPQASAYVQYLRYRYVYEQKSREVVFLELNPSADLPVEIELTIECTELAAALDSELRGVVNKAYFGASVSKDQVRGQICAATATVVVEGDEENPVFAIGGSDTTGVSIMASKVGHTPVRGEFVAEKIVTCLDLSCQELLIAKVASYILAAKPFLHQNLSGASPAAASVRDKGDPLDIVKQQHPFSSFDIAVKSITGNTNGVRLNVRHIQLALVPNRPIVAEIQEISAAVNGANLLHLCSIAVTPSMDREDIRIEVVTGSASISTNVEDFEKVKLLLASMKQRWTSGANSCVSDLQTKNSVNAQQDALSKKLQVILALRFEFIEYGALALEAFSIHSTFGDGWYSRLSAAGGTTEGWCHSIPPRSQDPFIDIQLWAGAFLEHSPFAGSIEDSGIAFACNFNHVTMCLGDDLISSVESLYDTVIMVLYKEEDRHVCLSQRDKYTTPYINGFFAASHMVLLLHSNGGGLGSLPGHADTTAPNSTDSRRPGATPPPPLTVELLGEDCLHVSLQRYCDKRMDIHAVLQKGVNAYLIGTPAHIPLLVPRDNMRAELDLRLCAPSGADLPIFPYSRLDLDMKVSSVALVTHIPTLATAWSYFNTSSLPLCRLRSIGSRLHFSSRPRRPGATLAPRSPVSASVEARGAAAFARISFLPENRARSASASLPTHTPCALYSTPVFPSDMRLSFEVAESELYYPWGEGSVAPLYLHAEVPKCEVVLLNRDECVEVTVRGCTVMPRVRTTLHTFPRAMGETAAQRAEADAAAESRGEDGTSEEAPPLTLSKEHSAHVGDSDEPSIPLHHLTSAAPASTAAVEGSAADSPANTQAAFPDEEGFAAPQHCASSPPASSLIQVHVVYTMDSRLPFKPETPEESLRVSLTAITVPGSGTLPGPLYASLRSPAEVAAWMTFFTFFNATNTVPLSTSSRAASASPAFTSVGKNNDGEGGNTTLTTTAQSPRHLITSLHTSPIVLHLPFAAVAAVLWDGVEFSASPGYSAFRIPKLDVLVHEQLWCGAATGVAASVQRLAALRDNGYAVLSLRSSSHSSSGSTGEADVIPAILLESHATTPTAVDVHWRLVLPAIVGQLAGATTLVQLQQCSTVAAVRAVFAARSAQTTLLNAVILQESQRQQLRYACCFAKSVGGRVNSSVDDADALAQLMPFLSRPLAIHIHSCCFTFEWMSGLQRDMRAGVTVALANVRCNDYDANSHLLAAQSTDNSCKTSAHGPRRFPVAAPVPLLVEVEAGEAYVWWTIAERSSTTETVVRKNAALLEEPRLASKQHPHLPPLAACMPLLLYPFQVRTRIDTAAHAADADAGETENVTDTAAATASGIRVSVQREDARVAAEEEEPEISFAVTGGESTTASAARHSKPLSTASFHTMSSATGDSRNTVTAAATPSAIMPCMRPAEEPPAPVFEVTPIHVILNTSAYVVLSEMLLHKVQGTTPATETGAQGSAAEAAPPALRSTAVVTGYYLMHRAVELPTTARGSATACSHSVPSPLAPVAYSRRAPSSYTSSLSNGFGSSPGWHASSPFARAQAVRAETVYVYRYDITLQQCVWVEKQSQASWQLEEQQPNGDNSARKEAVGACEPSLGGGEIAKGEQRICPASPIPPSSLHPIDGMLMLPTLAEHDAPVELREAETREGPAIPPPPSTAQEQMPRKPYQRPRASAHAAVAVPTVAPLASTKPRLQVRMTVSEVSLRLVYYHGDEANPAETSEARAFWQRYTVVHAASRRAAAVTPASATMAPTPCLMAFLAATVAPLRSLRSAIEHVSTNSSSAIRRRRRRSAGPPSRTRTLFQVGQPPAPLASAQQQLLAPTAMLEEACVDALCVRLSGIVVSGFTDARSVQLESCVCTSVKNPSRPLLSMTQVELYVPSSAVTYPSAAEAAKTVARDLEGSAWVAEVARGMEDAPEAEGVSASPMISRQDANSTAAPSAPEPSQPQPQRSVPTRHAGTSHSASSPSAATAPTATSASTGTWSCDGRGNQKHEVVMQGEVGCRVETLTIDLSAAALRAWLGCLVEQPVAAFRAAAEEEEKRLEAVAHWPRSADTVATATVPPEGSAEAATVPTLPPVQWRPGQGLRMHEIRGAFWSLEHDITLSRDGLVLFFSSRDTNLLTVYLNGHDIALDPSLLLRPAGLQRVVMVVQGGLTVRFVGSGRVRLPLALWSSSLVETASSVGVEAVLLPFMAVGEGSYLECSQVRLGFTEPAAGVKATEGGVAASVTAPPPPPPSSHADPHQSQLVHRNVHLHLPNISVIIEPRHESRKLHIRTAMESWMSLCNGRLLRDDVRCTGFLVVSESVYDTVTTTARTTVLAPVDISVCSNNGRHHAVSLGAVEVDLGRADLLIMSTYVGELQALRSYVKYLAHSKTEKAFVEMVEATLAWNVSASTTNNTGVHGEEGEQDSELYDDEGDISDRSEEEGEQEGLVSDAGGGSERERVLAAVPPSRTDCVRISRPIDIPPVAAGTGTGRDGPKCIGRPPSSSAERKTERCRQASHPNIPQRSAARKSGVAAALLRQAAAKGREEEEDEIRLNPSVHPRRQQQQLQRRRSRQRLRIQRQQSRGFSWAAFAPFVEVIFSDHRYPLVQIRVEDVMVRRTSTSALASTSLVRCQGASVQVHGRGRWDVLLKPSSTLTWSLTQTVSRHSSNRHASLVVEGVHWQCSHLIVAKLLYISHQFGILATSLRRRLTTAAAAVGEAGTAAAPALVAGVAITPAVSTGRGIQGLGRGSRGDTSTDSTSVSSDEDCGSDTANGKSCKGSSRQSKTSAETFSDTSIGAPLAVPLVSSSLLASAAADDSHAMSVPSSERGGYSRLSATEGTRAPMPTATISSRMATHRLLNNFSHTLFAGICEREAGAKVSSTAIPDVPSLPARSADPLSSGSTAVLMVWRCHELYRLPPASATDIFISYRRASSLMLTFFTADCVEWDEVSGVWALNPKGEAVLAERAISNAVIRKAQVHPTVQQQQLGTSGGASSFLSSDAVSAATTNCLAFTALQYGMARPLTIDTIVPRETSAAAALTPALALASSSYLSRNTLLRPRSPTTTGPRASITGTEINEHSDRDVSGGGFKTLAYSLALTCGDLEDSDTSRYPIVVASGEDDDNSLTPVLHQQQPHQRYSRRESFTASSATASMRLSCSASSQCVDSLAKDGALPCGRSPQDVTLQMARESSRSSSSSNSGACASRHTPDGFEPAECEGPRLHSPRGCHNLPQVHSGAASARPHPDQRPRNNATTSTTGNQQSVAQRRKQLHSHNIALVPPTVHRQPPQPSYHGPTAAASAASGQDTERGGGDLLVVCLQARSSLFNETGCTLQLLSSPEPLPAPNSAGDTSHLPATSATVPPGWQLPLDEEDVHNEVVLRACCPSARWMPPAAAPNAITAPLATMSVSGNTIGVTKAMDDATPHLRWYETRVILGQLESGRFLSFRRVGGETGGVSPLDEVTGAAAAEDSASFLRDRAASSRLGDDHDERVLLLFVIHTYSADGLVQHISLYPRLTLVNHLGLTARVVVLQQDSLAGPQTLDEAVLIAQWTAPLVGRGRHDRERFYRSLVVLGAHDALPHQRALPLHLCTYGSNLVLGLSLTQSTGDAFFTADLDPVITSLRDAVDHHPRLLQLRGSHGRAFYVQVSVMPRTVVLSVALWVYNLTGYPLLMSDSVARRSLCPGQNSTSGIIPSQGEPFLIGCQLADSTQVFFAIGMDGGWSGAVSINVGSSGVFTSSLSRLGITRSCNYSILFPNAQEGRPVVIQITPRWVFCNNTSKRLRLHFRFPGLERAMQQAEKRRRRLRMREAGASATERDSEAAGVPLADAEAAPQASRRRLLLEADDTVGALNSIAAVQLNPGDYHVSCIGPIEGNQFRVQEVLEGSLPTVASITSAGRVEHRDVASYYESQHTPYMDVDRPGEAMFNLWAAPRAPGKQVAVSYGSDLIVQRPSGPHPTELEPYDMYETDAVITGRIAVAVQSADNVLAVLLHPIQGTKILLQNRTASHTVMVRQQGSRRRNQIPPRQNRFFLWEDAREEHVIRVHILGHKGRWFDVDFSAGECQVTRHVDTDAAAAAQALARARQLHPHPTQVKPGSGLPGRMEAAVDFSFHVRGYTNAEKTRVTILVTESPVPVYAAIDSWRTSQAVSLRMTMMQLSWIQEIGTNAASAAKLATPFAIEDGGNGVVDDDSPSVVITLSEDTSSDGGTAVASAYGARVSPRRRSLRQRSTTARAAVAPASPSSVANAVLFSVILEGVQLERLSTEDNENFYFAVHQMQWVDEGLNAVFVYRARPRLPPAMAMFQGSGTPQGSAGAAAAAAAAKSNDSGSGGCAVPFAPITATANRLLSSALGLSETFLFSMEKQNDLELSYSLIKYADGVTRYTELRFVLTPLVVKLTDFLLVDMIQEARRIQALLGLRKQTAAPQATTTAPLVLTVSSLRQQQQQRQRQSGWRASGDEDTDSTMMVVVPVEDSFSYPFAPFSSRRLRQSSRSVVVTDGDTDAEVQPPEHRTLAVLPAPRHRSPNKGAGSEDTLQQYLERQASPLRQRACRSRSCDIDKSSTAAVSSVHTRRAGSEDERNSQAGERSDAERSVPTHTQPSQRCSNPSRAPTSANTAGFLSQAVFLQQLVQELRTRLEQRGVGVMAGSVAALTARGEERLRPRSGQLLLLPGGIAGASPEASHLQRLLGGTGNSHVCATTVDADRKRAVADLGGSGARALGDGGPGNLGSGAAATQNAARNVSTASLMFIERLEVERLTVYVTFARHSPDPLRPLLGAYAWMLPSQLRQREFYLPAWTLTRQVETPSSLRARLVRWGMHSLREQWTKVTKLGTLLDALQFWQHRALPLHGAPRPLTLSRVQRQQQERGAGGGPPLAAFASCVSSGEEENEDDSDDGNADAQGDDPLVERPFASP